MTRSRYRSFIGFLVAYTAIVVMVGATVRLMDAGLGCPDWPGCYGHLGVPQTKEQIAAADAAWPERPVDIAKGWWEMGHRYIAGILGLALVALAVIAWRRSRVTDTSATIPILLVLAVGVQSLLGAWTVTMMLKPIVVVGHLMGGLTILCVLWWLFLRERPTQLPPAPPGVRLAALLVLAVATTQVALGGWVSANYAALACTDFPTCHGQLWPDADYREGFTLWRGLGVDYEFGVLENPARVAIQFVHRLGGLVTVVALIGLATWTWLQRAPGGQKFWATAALVLGITQAMIGIGNVWFSLPLGLAVAHTGGAAALLMALVALVHQTTQGQAGLHPGPGRRA